MTSVADVLGNSHTASACALYLCGLFYRMVVRWWIGDEAGEPVVWNWWSRHYWSIDEAEPYASRVYNLHLSGFEDHGHAYRLLQFKNLKTLTYGWCRFEELPRQLLSLTNLTALTILNTPLREFPVWLSKLPNLQKLAIRGTEIHVIPPGIRHFLALRDFEFVNNDCFSVPDELAELRDLRHLNFGSTQIGTIPDAVLELPRLKSLLLTGTNFTAERALHVKLRFPKAVVRPAIAVRLPTVAPNDLHDANTPE